MLNFIVGVFGPFVVAYLLLFIGKSLATIFDMYNAAKHKGEFFPLGELVTISSCLKEIVKYFIVLFLTCSLLFFVIGDMAGIMHEILKSNPEVSPPVLGYWIFMFLGFLHSMANMNTQEFHEKYFLKFGKIFYSLFKIKKVE